MCKNYKTNIYRIYILIWILDLLPDDIIDVSNKHLIEAETNERRKERKKREKIQKEKKRRAEQYKICETLEKNYCTYNNISDYEFCI